MIGTSMSRGLLSAVCSLARIRVAMLIEDFPPAFLVVGAISASSALLFSQLPKDAGAELAERDKFRGKVDQAR